MLAYWLEFWAFTAVAQVQSLVGELISFKPCCVAKSKNKTKHAHMCTHAHTHIHTRAHTHTHTHTQPVVWVESGGPEVKVTEFLMEKENS